MKNNKWLLGAIILLSSCSNNMLQTEEDAMNALEKSAASINAEEMLQIQKDSISLLTANNTNESGLYPAMSFSLDHESYYVHDEVVINVPRLGREYVYNTVGQFPNLPKYNFTLNTGCYIQYRLHSNKKDDKQNWYYYHPDTIQSTTPYYLEVPNYHPDDYRLLTVRLNAARLPKRAFDIRGILCGGDYSTEWLPESHSYDPWELNTNGFLYQGDHDADRQEIYVNVRLHLDANLHIEARSSCLYELKFGDQVKQVYLNSGSNYIYHKFAVDKTLYNVPINSPYKVKMNFEGEEFEFNFYVSPAYRGEVKHAYAKADIHKYVY